MSDPSEPDATMLPPIGPLRPVGPRRKSKLWQYLAAALTAMALLVVTAIPAAAADLMRITFIRHGQSYGNLSGLIDTSTPGPVLTDLGTQQAKDVAKALGDNNYDAIYASQMVRTQLTAAPMSQYLGLPIQVLPGIQEIEAGIYEGTPEAAAQAGYGMVLLKWATGIPPYNIPQDKSVVMPGTDLDGYTFDERMRAALQTIYDNGDRNAAVFSHGGAIMFWTLMNVTNLTLAEKFQLISSGASLDNTDSVVIEGNNEDGWTLVRWKDQEFAPEPTFWGAVKIQSRTLHRQLDTAWQQLRDAFATRDPLTIKTAWNHTIADVSFSITKYNRAVKAIIIDKFFTPKTPAPATVAPEATPVADSTAVNASAPQSVAPAQETAPAVAPKVAGVTSDNKVAAKVQTSAPTALSAVADPEPATEPTETGVSEATAATEATAAKEAKADKGKPARAERPRHGLRAAASSGDDQAGASTPKRDVKKSKKSAATSSPSGGAGSDADSGGQRDAA